MKEKILKYTFSLFCCFLSVIPFYGQEKEKEEKVKKQHYFDGIRFSYDVSTYLKNYLYPFRKEQEFQFDAFFNEKFLVSGGFGITNIERTEHNFTYDESGTFFKAGVDYNTLNDRRNILTVGGRLGTSFFEHQARNIGIVAYDSIWNNFEGGALETEKFFAAWLELALNMKVEVIKQIYLGWSIQPKLLLYNSRGREIEPYEIPGFGRGDKNAVFGFNYFVSLHVPLTGFNNKQK